MSSISTKSTKTDASEIDDAEFVKQRPFTFWSIVFGVKKERKVQYSEGLQVIGAGLGRTGTSSLKKALEILYEGEPCYHMSEVIENDHVNFWLNMNEGKMDQAQIREHFSRYATTTDYPACVYWKELLKAYPNAKVVLSVRSSESWCKSVNETIYRMNPDNPKKALGVVIMHTGKHF